MLEKHQTKVIYHQVCLYTKTVNSPSPRHGIRAEELEKVTNPKQIPSPESACLVTNLARCSGLEGGDTRCEPSHEVLKGHTYLETYITKYTSVRRKRCRIFMCTSIRRHTWPAAPDLKDVTLGTKPATAGVAALLTGSHPAPILVRGRGFRV